MASILAANDAPVEATFVPAATWQEAMKRAVRDGRQLCEMLGLDPALANLSAQSQFPVFAPLEFISRMHSGDPHDPLLLQVLAGVAEAQQLAPTGKPPDRGQPPAPANDRPGQTPQTAADLAEPPRGQTAVDVWGLSPQTPNNDVGGLSPSEGQSTSIRGLSLSDDTRGQTPGYNAEGQSPRVLPQDDWGQSTRDSGGSPEEGHLLDPVGDLDAQRMPGLLQKYDGRALILASGACAVHCRYCFRRHFPYNQLPTGRKAWTEVIHQIQADESLHEVILSGGDPLTLVDRQLKWLVEQLDAIAHLRRLRFHTRLPIVIPQRVTDELLHLISTRRTAVYVVLHSNHPRELDEHVLSACRRLQRAGAVLLNQAVLLHGINDSPSVQLELCERLVDAQVLPYYLHQLDLVAGGMHFRVADQTGLDIIAHLRTRLPGYAVPRLVREIAGEPSKTPVA